MFPAHFGGSSFAVSAPNPAVLELVRRLGKALRYSGHAGIEFRWDARDERYKYVELNPRLPHNVEFDDFCGLPTVWNSYRVALDGYASFAAGTQRDGLLYFDVMDDLKGRLADGERFWTILTDYARNLARKKDGVYFAWDDPRPGVWMTGRAVRAGIQRLRRRAPGRRQVRRDLE
jgi:predicted ATP-grasp superfamily ATP-dependent carboligase